MLGWYIESRRFDGTLAFGDQSLNLAFTAGVADTSEVSIELEPIARTQESRFVREIWQGTGSGFGEFLLSGTAADGTEFVTEDLIFTTLGLSWGHDAGFMRPVTHCSVAKLTLTRTPEDRDGARLLLRGLRVRGNLTAETPIGSLVSRQTVDNARDDQISGEISLLWTSEPTDFTRWLEDAESLFKDVRYALSLALGLMIAGPIREVVREAR